MKTHVLANDEVYLHLAPGEHRVLTDSLYYLLTDLDRHRVEPTLGMEADDAYEFAYAIYVAEAAARVAGVSWLASEQPDVVDHGDDIPVVPILFTDDGSQWRLRIEQLWLIEAVATEVARRAT